MIGTTLTGRAFIHGLDSHGIGDKAPGDDQWEGITSNLGLAQLVRVNHVLEVCDRAHVVDHVVDVGLKCHSGQTRCLDKLLLAALTVLAFLGVALFLDGILRGGPPRKSRDGA